MKIAVILSGCGYLDGAEVREAVLALLYLDQEGAEVSMFAPDMVQRDVVNHLTGEAVEGASRNILEESARIARGKVSPLAELNVADFDGLVIPGGFGVAKNLSDLAIAGADAVVLPEFATAVRSFYEADKPIGALCIAPAVIAAILKGEGLTLTIGDDEGTAGAIEAFGNHHKNCETNDFVTDLAKKLFTCSAYMREDNIADVAKGIEKVVKSTVSACK